ncbi:MAG TPA: hypothetical protein VMG31_09235 [Verrucomicrobiae bacterium]|nr:hypothetical protein [Verrucomicrobiae bacterium]
MPLRYVIYRELRLVVSTGQDRLTYDEARAHQEQLIRDPDFNPEFNQLLDATAVTDVEIVTDQARMLATRSVFASTSRRAFVATRPAIFGMGRVFGSYHETIKEPSHVRVFYDMPSALEWLGLKELPK